jgi:hypothetical protein
MKRLLIAAMFLFLILPVVAQKPDDLKQDIAEMKQEIKDIEAEIADAKINYPEDVPELQKDLATMKKMLASFEKMAGMSSAPQPKAAKTVPAAKPSYNSPIVSLNLSQPITAPAPSQATDRLLWYTGKKINDSTLITTRALVVQYQPKRNRVVAQPEKKSDPFQKMIDELEKTEGRKDELIDKFSNMKNGTLLYPDLMYGLKLYDDIEERYDAAVKNTIDLPEVNLSGSNYAPSNIDNLPNENQDLINDFIKWCNEELKRADDLEAKLPPWENFPPPPVSDLTICSTCDESILEREKREDAIWQKEFMDREAEIIRIRLGVARAMQLMGVEQGIEIQDIADLTALNRMGKKIKLLYEKYGKDLKYAKTVLPIVLGFERQKQLLGIEDGSSILSELVGVFNDVYPKYFKEQMGLKNYNFVLNIAYHLGVERQRQLLGMSDNESTDSPIEFDMAMDFNRFALTLDLDFIFETVDDEDELELKATGVIFTKDKAYVRLYLDGCSWRMVLFEADYNNASQQHVAIPLKVNTGVKTIRDKEDNLITFPYTGPEDMVAFLPEFKIDLCDVTKRDSAFMMAISLPYGSSPQLTDPNKSYKFEMVPFANHMFVDLKKMEDNASEVMDLAADIIVTASESRVTHPTGNPKLDKMQNEYNIKIAQDAHKKDFSQLSLNKKSVFLFNANNGSTVFIDQTNDTRHTIDENTKLVKGLIHLRVFHEPIVANK